MTGPQPLSVTPDDFLDDVLKPVLGDHHDAFYAEQEKHDCEVSGIFLRVQRDMQSQFQAIL